MQPLRYLIPALACIAGWAAADASAQLPLSSAPLRTFDATQLSPDRYTVVKRLWVGSWRSAFFVPTRADSAAALAQLSDAAAEAGADALVNVVCLNDAHALLARGYSCYGLAVRLR